MEMSQLEMVERLELFIAVQILELRRLIMSGQDQIAQLDADDAALAQAVADQKARVDAKIADQDAAIAALKAAVPPTVDLSAQLAAVESATAALNGEYAAPVAVSVVGPAPPVAQTPVTPPAISSDPTTDNSVVTDAPPVVAPGPNAPVPGNPSSPDDVTNSEPAPVQ